MGNPEILEFALSQETARTALLLPLVEAGGESSVSVSPLSQERAISFSSGLSGPWDDSVRCPVTHSRPRPILPVAKRVRFGDDIPPHAPLASPVWDPGSSVRMPQNAPPSVPSTPTPFRCTTTGMSIVPLEPLAQRLVCGSLCPACLAGSRRQFDSATRFSSPGDLPSSTAISRRRWQSGTPLSWGGDCCPPGKGRNQAGPSSREEAGVLQPLLHVPKKCGGLRPILDLRVLNWALHKLPFKMRTCRRIIKCIQPQDWFAAIDLKDAYFHVLILLRHRPFLRFAFERSGMVVQGPPCLPVCSRRS